MSLCDDIRELEENLSQYGRLIDEIAKELGCNPDNEKIMEAIGDLKSRVAVDKSAPAWPNVGDTYWFITGNNTIQSYAIPCINRESNAHFGRIEIGNCYRTEEDAKRMAQARADLAALRRAEDTGDCVKISHIYVSFDERVISITGRGFSTADRREAFVNSLGKNKKERLSAIAEYLFGPK